MLAMRVPLMICLAVVVVTSLLPGVSLAGHAGGLLGGAFATAARCKNLQVREEGMSF